MEVEFSDGFETSTISIPMKTLAATSMSTTSTKPSRTQFRYVTFIPDDHINVPWVCDPLHSSDTYNGNNRSWKTASGESSLSNKTMMASTVNWTSQTFTQTKSVSRSYQYTPSGTIRKSAVASSAGMKFGYNVISPSYARTRLNHSVANPLCGVAGPISYWAIVDTWRNGTTQVVGSRAKAPNHEFYARSASTSWTILGRLQLKAFYCLNTSVTCGPAESFRVTKTVR